MTKSQTNLKVRASRNIGLELIINYNSSPFIKRCHEVIRWATNTWCTSAVTPVVYLPEGNTTLIPKVTSSFELIFTLKDTYKSQIQNRGLAEMNGINSVAISYIRAIKKKMTERHSRANKTVTIASLYCEIRPGRGLDAISCHHYTEMNTGVWGQLPLFDWMFVFSRIKCDRTEYHKMVASGIHIHEFTTLIAWYEAVCQKS